MRRRLAMRAPVDVRRRGHRDAVRAQVALDEPLRPGVVEDLDLERGRVARDPQVGRLARRVARLRQRDLDAEDANDRAGHLAAGPVQPVGPPPAAGAHDGAHLVRPRLEVAGRAPRDLVRSGRERPLDLPHDLAERLADPDRVRADDLEADARPAGEREADERPAPGRPARADRGQARPVARERASPVRGAQVVELRHRRRGPGGCREAERGQRPPAETASVASTRPTVARPGAGPNDFHTLRSACAYFRVRYCTHAAPRRLRQPCSPSHCPVRRRRPSGLRATAPFPSAISTGRSRSW